MIVFRLLQGAGKTRKQDRSDPSGLNRLKPDPAKA